MLDQSALRDAAGALLSAAREAGADAADVLGVTEISESVSVRDGTVEESERSEAQNLGLRVFAGKRQALISTNALDHAAFGALAEKAVAMARLAPENPFAGLAEVVETPHDAGALDLLDPTRLSTNALLEQARIAEKAMLGVKGVSKSAGTGAAHGFGGAVLMTSTGCEGA